MTRLVVQYTDSVGFGGAEKMLLHLVDGLDPVEWQPLLVYHPSPGIQPLVHEAEVRGMWTEAVPPMPQGIVGARRIPHFVGLLRAWGPAIFHAHLTWPLACKQALAGALIARVPGVVATAHLFVDLPYTRLARLQQRVLINSLGAYIAVSRDTADRVRRAFGARQHKLHVIHNGVPSLAFDAHQSAAMRASLGVQDGQSLVVACARLEPQKGIDYLLRAAAEVPNARFAVAGEGPERARLASDAERLGVRERFVFLGQRGDVPALLGACDLFVLPSLYEGLPVSILEAMSVGKPVIATAVGGTDEVVWHGTTGLLVPPRDPSALAGAIRSVLADPGLARRLGAAGQQRARTEFSWDRAVQRVQDVYRSLLPGRGR